MMKEQCLRFFQKRKENSEKQFWEIWEKDILFGEKKYFRKSKIDNGQKKKTKPKGEEQLKVFHSEMKKESEKGDWVKHKDLAKKRR